MDKALEIISGLKENWLKTLLQVMIVLPLVCNGVWQFGVDTGLWSKRVGELLPFFQRQKVIAIRFFMRKKTL